MPDPFPPIQLVNDRKHGEDRNPAIQLFGRRFSPDQTVAELLVELLLVAASFKRIGDTLIEESILPDLSVLRSWPDKKHLTYAAKARLNLKLFSFFAASKLETQHETHKEHYNRLRSLLKNPDKLSVPDGFNREEVLRTMEQLFLGLQGAGSSRTWCAQTFVPVDQSFLSAETIWNETQAKRDGVGYWHDVMEKFMHYFSVGRHRFLARGGEVIYLQICNALRQDQATIQHWSSEKDMGLSPAEKSPDLLHEAVSEGIQQVLHGGQSGIGELASFIDTGVEAETAQGTDCDRSDDTRYTRCGWCPVDSWPEGYLFAIALVRLTHAAIDPMEKIALLELACGIQLLRSLCAQSARYTLQSCEVVGSLGYIWAISDPDAQHPVVKKISQRCVKKIEKMIYDAIREPDIHQRMDRQISNGWKDLYQEADKGYGHKLFLKTAKTIGLIVPRQGPGARFVLTERLLRLLVMTVIRPGERVTYDSFKDMVFAHYGLALDSSRLCAACKWIGIGQITTIGGVPDAWVQRQLTASGMLIRLSDSCSMVKNPFDRGKES